MFEQVMGKEFPLGPPQYNEVSPPKILPQVASQSALHHGVTAWDNIHHGVTAHRESRCNRPTTRKAWVRLADTGCVCLIKRFKVQGSRFRIQGSGRLRKGYEPSICLSVATVALYTKSTCAPQYASRRKATRVTPAGSCGKTRSVLFKARSPPYP